MRLIDADALIEEYDRVHVGPPGNARKLMEDAPTVESEVVMCKDCIHRPIIDDPDAKDGFGLLFPDFRCPCRCDDGYYSWMPKDNWFCGNGERRIENDK